MSRTADIHRTTGETDVALSLDLDGAGAGERAHGRRLLRPPARRAGPPRRPRPRRAACEGDLETGPAPHGGGHRHRARPGARRGAGRPRRASPASASAVVPMDEARAQLRDRRLRAGRYTAFEARLPAPSASADFDTDLAEEFLRAVANTAKLTLHVRVEAGTNAHHMVEACFKAFARALRAGRGDRPARAGRARPRRGCCERAGRDPRLRHGQPALGREGARARGRRSRELTARPRRACARPTAWCCPAWARCPKAMERVRELGLDELLRERRGRRRARDRHLHGHAAAVRVAPPSSAAPRASGCCAGAVRALDAPGLKVPQIGWNPVVVAARVSALNEGLPDPCAFYHVHSFAPRPARPGGRARHRRLRQRVRQRGGAAAASTGVQFHPEKSGPDGLRLLGELRRSCVAAPHDPPARRWTSATARPCACAQGDFDERDRLRRRPARGRALVRGGRARASCTWWTSTARARASRPTSTTCERITQRAGRAGAVRRRPALDSQSVREALAAGAERVVLGTAAYTRPGPARRGARARGPRACSWRSTCAAGSVSVAGWTQETQMRRRGRDRAPAAARRDAASSTRTSTATGCSRAPTSTRSRRIAGGGARPLPLLGRDRLARATCARCATLRLVNLAGVISGKALYEGRFTSPRRRRRWRSRLMLLRRVIPCLDVDKGRVVKGIEFVQPARRRRPGRAGRRATRRRAPTSSCSSTSPRRTRSARRSSSWRGAAPTTSSSRSRSAAASARSRTPRPCSTRAPTRCR